jgi:hypothetical protein
VADGPSPSRTDRPGHQGEKRQGALRCRPQRQARRDDSGRRRPLQALATA